MPPPNINSLNKAAVLSAGICVCLAYITAPSSELSDRFCRYVSELLGLVLFLKTIGSKNLEYVCELAISYVPKVIFL